MSENEHGRTPGSSPSPPERTGPLTRILARFPERCRGPLVYESAYNIGNGAFYSLNLLTPVVLATAPLKGATEDHVAIFWAAAHGSSVFSPLVGFGARFVPMKLLVVVPNLLAVLCLLGVAFKQGDPTWFTTALAAAFVVRVFPRTGEMNMYRVLYPTSHRGAAVGLLKAIMAISVLLVVVAGYFWLNFDASRYWMIYLAIAAALLLSSFCYQAIPVRQQDLLEMSGLVSPWSAFYDGLKDFLNDRRFLMYQIGFSFAGTANHMVFWLVPYLCINDLKLGDVKTRFISALIPALLVTFSAPLWGRYLDRFNPMIGRATFNLLQGIAFLLFAVGGLGSQEALVITAAVLHGIASGGSAVNWLTGSLHFAGKDRVSLYNAVHVGLTGIRGLLAPLVGLWFYDAGTTASAKASLLDYFGLNGLGLGPHVFWVAAGLSFCGFMTMLWQGLVDPGPRDEQLESI